MACPRSNLCLFANDVEEGGVDVLGQVAGLQRTALFLVGQARALPGDGAAAESGERKGFGGGQVVLVVPELVVVGLSVGEEGGQRTGQSVALASGALQASLVVVDKGDLAVGNVVLCALLDDGGAAKGLGQLFAQLCRVAGGVDALCLCQAAELDDVGGQDALGAALDQLRAVLDDEEAVGVDDEGDALFAGFLDDAGAGFLHGLVAAETGPDDDDVQARQHVGDGL